jgi:tetratricopeptide (TPR) repeat protein
MRKKANFIFIAILFFLCFNSLNAQETSVNEKLAIEYFKQKEYEKALPLFIELINKSPDNAMLNYYYGITLLKNNHFKTAAKEALLNAVVDNTPSNTNFYLGNYFHALGSWTEAMDFYKRYKGSKQESKELEYDKYVALCSQQINPFKVDQGDDKTVFTDSIKAPVKQPNEKIFPIPDSLKSEWFNFEINSQLTYHGIYDFQSEAAKILFTKAWLVTSKNDSIVRNTDSLRKAHEETTSVTARIALVQRIVDAEQQSYQLLHDREKFFEQARVKESGYWEKTGNELMVQFASQIAQREKARAEQILNSQKNKEKDLEKTAKVQSSTPLEESNKTETAIQNAIAVKEVIQFKVQIGSFLHGKLTPAFKVKYTKLAKFRKIEKFTDAKKYQIYTIGNFAAYKDAVLLKNQLVMEGLKTAVIVAFKNGEQVPLKSVVK